MRPTDEERRKRIMRRVQTTGTTVEESARIEDNLQKFFDTLSPSVQLTSTGYRIIRDRVGPKRRKKR